jgi:hypothetical protein
MRRLEMCFVILNESSSEESLFGRVMILFLLNPLMRKDCTRVAGLAVCNRTGGNSSFSSLSQTVVRRQRQG